VGVGADMVFGCVVGIVERGGRGLINRSEVAYVITCDYF
jgi:hypothetical protein